MGIHEQMSEPKAGALPLSELPQGLAPWWEERHQTAVDQQFFRDIKLLDQDELRELVDIMKFILWQQNCKQGKWEWPSATIVRGALLRPIWRMRVALRGIS